MRGAGPDSRSPAARRPRRGQRGLRRQPSLGRQVALKRSLDPGDSKVETRPAKEIRALGRVDHPSLVQTHTRGSDGERWFYAMELIDGADLANVVEQLSGSSAPVIDASPWQQAFSSACEEARKKERPASSTRDDEARSPVEPAEMGQPVQPRPVQLSPGEEPIERSVEGVRQAAAAAHALHQTGVLHRDIKPGNIVLAADGPHALLMDLGLAQIADGAEGRLTRTRQFVGTLRNARGAAPRGRPGRSSERRPQPRSDALGAADPEASLRSRRGDADAGADVEDSVAGAPAGAAARLAGFASSGEVFGPAVRTWRARASQRRTRTSSLKLRINFEGRTFPFSYS